MARNTEDQAPTNLFPTEEQALAEAIAERNVAQASLQTAAGSNDLKVMLEAGTKLVQANTAVARAQTKLDAAAYEFKSTERMALSVSVKEATEQFAAGIDTAGMFRLGLKGIHVVITEDGSVVVSVSATEKPKASAKSGTRVPAEGTRSRAGILYQGATYTSRQFLELFPEGLEAIDRNDNWEAKGLKARPGFDQALKSLMEANGATREGAE